jgi:hypothetical protein
MAVAETNIIYGNLHGSVAMRMVRRDVMDNFRGKVYVLIAAPEPGYLAVSAVNRILLPMVAYLGPSFLVEFTDIMNRKGTDINILKKFITSRVFSKLYRHWAYLRVSIEYIINLHENISAEQRRGMPFPVLPIFSVYTKKYPPPEMMLETSNEVDIYNTSPDYIPDFGTSGPTGAAGPSSSRAIGETGATGATGSSGPTGPSYLPPFPNFLNISGELTMNNYFFNSFKTFDNSCYLHRVKNYTDPLSSAEPKIFTIRNMTIPFGTYSNYEGGGLDVKVTNTSSIDIVNANLKYNKTPTVPVNLTDFLTHHAGALGPRNTEDNVTYIILTSCKAIPNQHIEKSVDGSRTYFTVKDIASRQPYLPFDVPAFTGRRASKRPIFDIEAVGEIRSIKSQRISMGSKRKPIFYASITGQQLNAFNELRNKILETLSTCIGDPYLQLTPDHNVVVFFKRKIDLVRKHLMTLLVRESNNNIFIEEICKDPSSNPVFIEKAFNKWVMDKTRNRTDVYAAVDPRKGNLLDNINKYTELRGFTLVNFVSAYIQNINFASPRFILKYTSDNHTFNINELNSAILVPIIKNIPENIFFIQNTEGSIDLFVDIIKTLIDINKIEDQDQINRKCVDIINSSYYRGVNIDLFNIPRISSIDSVSRGFEKLNRDWLSTGSDPAFIAIFETKMTELLRYLRLSIPDPVSIVNVRSDILEYITNVNIPENIEILEQGYFSAREPMDEFRNIYYVSVPSDSLNATPKLKNALVQSMNNCFGAIYGQNTGQTIADRGYMVYLFYASRSHVGMNPEFFMSVKQQQTFINGQFELNAYIYNVCRSGKRRIKNFVRNCILKWVNDNKDNYNNIYLGVELLKQPAETIFNLVSLYASCQIGTAVEITTNIESDNGTPATGSLCLKMKREGSLINTPENVKNAFRTFLGVGYILTFFKIIEKQGIDSIESLTLINFINEISTQTTPHEIVEFFKEKLKEFYEIFPRCDISVKSETISSITSINILLQYIHSVIARDYPDAYQKIYDKLSILG